ncbi:MAG: hypothetical protein EOP86_16245, partial [Verrucomicrobiaceae bacterium]
MKLWPAGRPNPESSAFSIGSVMQRLTVHPQRDAFRRSRVQLHQGAGVTAVFARLNDPVEFDSVDDQPVDLLMLLLAPMGARSSIRRSTGWSSTES